jgi:hypothetical protein
VVQASPHDVPFGTNPSVGHGAAVPSQVSATSHTVAAVRQTVPLACGGCVHVPEPLHTSSVHALPSSPHGTNGVETQVFAFSSHVARQSGDAVHGSPACASQSPASHVSAPLQNTPSSQEAPSGWNWPRQRPTLSQRSSAVQELPSKHVAPWPTNWQLNLQQLVTK